MEYNSIRKYHKLIVYLLINILTNRYKVNYHPTRKTIDFTGILH